MVWQGLLQSADHRGADHQPDRSRCTTAFLSAIIGTLAALGLERMQRLAPPCSSTRLIYIAIMVPGMVIGISTLIAFVTLFDIVNPYLDGGLEHPHRNGRVDGDRRPCAVQHRGGRACSCGRGLPAWTAAWSRPRRISTPRRSAPSARSCCRCWRPSILAGFLLAFTFSFEDFIIAFFVAGPNITLPIYVFSSIRRGVTPEINAIGTVVLMTSLVLLVLAQVILQRGSRTLKT